MSTKLNKSINNYPQNREWKYKTFGMPKLPVNDFGMPGAIYKILDSVRNGKSPNEYINFKGNSGSFKLDRMYEWLRPIGLLHKENLIWKLTNYSDHYLNTHDDLYLTAVFCSSLVFMGEILYFLDTPKKMNELLDIAVNLYKINWKTPSEIRNRLRWFRDLNMVNYEDYKLEYSLTEKGRIFLNKIQIIKPESLEKKIDKTENEIDLYLSDWIKEIWYINNGKERKMSIGYIPGKTIDAIITINGYLQLLSQETHIDEIRNYSTTNYQIAISSTNTFLKFLNNMGFIDRITKMSYKISQLGQKWLDNISDLNFIICLDTSFLFVFELLAELNKESRTTKELAAIAKTSYGFDRENIDEIRKRIIFLKNASLIIEDGLEKYKITNRGKLLLQLFEIKIKEKDNIDILADNFMTNNNNKDNYFVEELITELRLASNDSSNPNRFEKIIKEAFEFLGFKTTLLGGSGKTDVLIQAQTSEKYSYKVAVDGKSTSSGAVGEGLVNFDSLQEHRKLHKANYSLVIGCRFQGDKIFDRAQKNKVALLDIDSFESLIREHAITPLTSEDYKKIFQQTGLIDTELIDDCRNIINRYGLLVSAIMKCLINESMDEVTKGLLSTKEIYRTVRDDSEYLIEPSIEEIEDIVNFLSSPLIGCVGKVKNEFYALGSLNEAGNKFRFYARACLNTNFR